MGEEFISAAVELHAASSEVDGKPLIYVKRDASVRELGQESQVKAVLVLRLFYQGEEVALHA